MSAFGAAVGKAVGSIGGPQVAAAVLVGGLVVGGLAGGIVARGPSGQPAQSSGQLSIYPCPNTGPAWASVSSGQKFLVTGKLADASWVRIYWPLPNRDEAWVQAGPLTFKDSLASVPVVTCSPVIAPLAASVEPSSSFTAIQDNSPSPGPTSSVQVARNTAPALARLAAVPSTIAGGPERYCAQTARSVTFSVRATDADTVADVVLSYREPGASSFATKPMTKAPGSDTWQATLRTDTDGITGAGTLRYFVSATDANASPRTARLPGSGTGSISVAGCSNGGPTLASLKASPSTVHTNPGACRSGATTTTVSVNASDVDTVTGATLFYRLPGDGSYRQKSMAKNGSTWSAKVTPLDQRPNADGKATYYVQSQDKLGKSAKSATRSFAVDRCNYPADFGTVNFDTPQACASSTTVFANVTRARDPDGLTASSATVVYTYTPKGGSPKTARRSIGQTQTVGDQHYYSGQFTLTGLAAGSIVSGYVTLTDKYGHTNKDLADQFKFQVAAGC